MALMMSTRDGVIARLRRYEWKAAAWTAAWTVTGVLLLVIVVRDVLGWDFAEASRSPLAVQEPFGPRYGGWFGSFGVLGWSLTAAISGLGAEVMRRRQQPRESTFLVASTVLSAGLLLDDLFLVHSTLAPQYLGISKPAVLLGIVIIALLWASAFWRRLLTDPDLPILIWAAGWYGLALLIDGYGEFIGWGGVREQAAKLIGVSTWLVFFWRTTLRSVQPRDHGRE